MKILLIIAAAIICIYLYEKSTRTEKPNRPQQNKFVDIEDCIGHVKYSMFRIAGISRRCKSKDVGIIIGKTAYEPTNPHDRNAIVIIANPEQPDEKVLGYIPAQDQEHYNSYLAKGEPELPFVGFIEEFVNSDGENGIYGKIKVYSGEITDVEAAMKKDVQFLTKAFDERMYSRRMGILDEF